MTKQYKELGGKRNFGDIKPEDDIMEQMPPAAENSGRIITDTKTKKRYKSDGKTWKEI